MKLLLDLENLFFNFMKKIFESLDKYNFWVLLYYFIIITLHIT